MFNALNKIHLFMFIPYFVFINYKLRFAHPCRSATTTTARIVHPRCQFSQTSPLPRPSRQPLQSPQRVAFIT